MATDAAANNTDDLRSPNFDGFLNEPPYCYGWTKNANGVKVPVFPYVISILGHLNLKKLGVQPEEEERATQLMKNTLAVYLEQVIKRWKAKNHFWQKESELPLIILINIADKIGELITDVVEELQKKYSFVRLIAVLPLPKDEFVRQLKEEREDAETIRAFEERYMDFEKNGNGKNQKYIWELSKREMPHIAKQTKQKKWRMFNEFVAQHSHLMIVFWQGGKDNWKDQDDSLTWAVRYKLEGYPGLSRNEQTDLITYPAIGPVLHIQTDQETFRSSKDFLPVYFYSDRATITQEIEGERKLIISDPKFWNLEKLRHTWFGRKFSDLGRHPEIYKNFQILKDLNYACQDPKNPLKNPSLRSFIETFVSERYKKSHKPIDKNDIPGTDKPTGQLIAYYYVLVTLANHFREKTRRLVNLFCGAFLILLVFNALLIFLNDLCIMGFGHNVFHLTQYYSTQWIPGQQTSFEGNYCEHFLSSIKSCLPQATFNQELNDLIDTYALNISKIIGIFMVTCLTVLLCILTIFYCCIASLKNSWHYKYHQFRTLADCLRVQVFWKIVGMDYSVSANFRSHQIPAVDWLLMALNGLNVTIPNSEKIESTQKLKDRIKMLDTIWIEDRIIAFKKMYKMNKYKWIWESLTIFSKLTVFVAVSVIPFLTAFFGSLGFQSCWGKLSGFEGTPFRDAFFMASKATLVFWLAILVWLVFKAIQRWLKKHLKWAEIHYNGFSGFLGNLYRSIKQNKNTKHYFLVPDSARVFHASIIIIACFGAIFELRRLNLLYAAAQAPSVEHIYNFLMVVRLITQIVVSIMAIGWLFNRMSMFDKKRRRIEQLYYPFELADYSIDTLLGDEKAVENINTSFWDNIISWYGLSSKECRSISKNDIDDEENDEEAKIKICQQVLLELGQEVLAKRADWLLAVSDRNLQSPK